MIVSVFSDGVSHCGVFLAASIIVETLRVQEKVDIFHIVKLIRRSHPDFIQNKVMFLFVDGTERRRHNVNAYMLASVGNYTELICN